MPMSMTMRVVIMPIPRMTQTLKPFHLFNLYSTKPKIKCSIGVDKDKTEYYQERSTVLLSPVKNPEPAGSTIGYACENMPRSQNCRSKLWNLNINEITNCPCAHLEFQKKYNIRILGSSLKTMLAQLLSDQVNCNYSHLTRVSNCPNDLQLTERGKLNWRLQYHATCISVDCGLVRFWFTPLPQLWL